MPLRELAKNRWPSYFDQLSKSLGAQRVDIEVTGLGLGDQVAARLVGLRGVSYDPHDDSLTVFVDGLEHRIAHPRRIHIDHDLDVLHSIEAFDAEGNHHIVQLSEPLGLPAP